MAFCGMVRPAVQAKHPGLLRVPPTGCVYSHRTIATQAAGGHGRWEGDRTQVEAHLGCASDLPRLRRPWMASQPYNQ
ncbi:hypothetical protein LBMAG47_05360 [Planctomycetia bacterium]|jgi:hypothetical protein|nr:hypothetical protein LBMAG47_05360 [Planctomycetia bacterium]